MYEQDSHFRIEDIFRSSADLASEDKKDHQNFSPLKTLETPTIQVDFHDNPRRLENPLLGEKGGSHGNEGRLRQSQF